MHLYANIDCGSPPKVTNKGVYVNRALTTYCFTTNYSPGKLVYYTCSYPAGSEYNGILGGDLSQETDADLSDHNLSIFQCSFNSHMSIIHVVSIFGFILHVLARFVVFKQNI